MNEPPTAKRMRLLRDEDLRQLLVGKAIRVTAQRMTILRELSKLRLPTSHPELTERLGKASLDRATIYRNLVALTEAGILVRTQLGDNVWRFELPHTSSTQHGRHPHFVCNDCGNVACLPEGAVTLQAEAIENQVAEVQLRGRCYACARA